MRVAVTGGTGHIGGNLVRALLQAGHAVSVLVHESTTAIDGLDVVRVTGDVRSLESLRELFEGVDVVFHLAARVSIDGDHGGLVQEINVEGTRNVVTAAVETKVRRLVHASSIHAFDMKPGQPITEKSPRAASSRHSAYDRSKAVGEAQVRQGIEQGLDALIVNPTGVIGPFDFRPSRIGAFLLMLQRRSIPMLVEGGFDWVDVRDVVSSMIAAMERGKAGENYNLSGHYATLRELANLAQQVTGVAPPRLTTPQWLARVAAPAATAAARFLHKEPLWTRESLASLRLGRPVPSEKAQNELGHDPRSLRKTLEDTFLWFRETGAIASDVKLNVE